MAFGLFFFFWLLFFTEFNTGCSISRLVLFKGGSKISSSPCDCADDEEKGRSSSVSEHREELVIDTSNGKRDAREAVTSQPKMTDLFLWQHINYTVPVSGGQNSQLLNDISGFVAPGKLTALMGESGAGKVCQRRLLTP